MPLLEHRVVGPAARAKAEAPVFRRLEAREQHAAHQLDAAEPHAQPRRGLRMAHAHGAPRARAQRRGGGRHHAVECLAAEGYLQPVSLGAEQHAHAERRAGLGPRLLGQLAEAEAQPVQQRRAPDAHLEGCVEGGPAVHRAGRRRQHRSTRARVRALCEPEPAVGLLPSGGTQPRTAEQQYAGSGAPQAKVSVGEALRTDVALLGTVGRL